MNCYRTLFVLVGFLACPLIGHAAVVIDLDETIGGSPQQLNLSSDGTTIVGTFFETGVGFKIFRWTAEQGHETFFSVNPDSEAQGVSDVSSNGRTFIGGVGATLPNASTEAFIWKDSEGLQRLGNPGPGIELTPFSYSTKVSPDGGTVLFRSNETGAYLWDSTNGERRPPMEFPSDLSSGGTVIVGSDLFGSLDPREFRPSIWTEENGLVEITSFSGEALQVTPDGRWVAGWLGEPAVQAQSLFLWSEHTGLMDIGNFDSSFSPRWIRSSGITDDGSMIVGSVLLEDGVNLQDGVYSFIWTIDGGLRIFDDYLTNDLGVDLETGIFNARIRGVSGDGKTMLVTAGSQSWLITTVPEPNSLLLFFLASAGLSYQQCRR